MQFYFNNKFDVQLVSIRIIGCSRGREAGGLVTSVNIKRNFALTPRFRETLCIVLPQTKFQGQPKVRIDE